MKETGMMICLFARPEVILERTKNYKHRPLLNVCDPLKKITELLDFRQPYYEKADYKIDTSDLEIRDVVERILEIIK
jgi:shikimate kinase